MIQQSHSLAYIQRNHNSKRYRNLMFTAALFMIAKSWKQPKCPWTDKWVKKMRYTLSHRYWIVLNHKKEQNNDICSNMDEIRDYHNKSSKSDKDKYHMIITYMWKWTYLQNRNRPIDKINTLMVTKAERWVGG